jgi:hypothetical protein
MISRIFSKAKCQIINNKEPLIEEVLQKIDKGMKDQILQIVDQE